MTTNYDASAVGSLRVRASRFIIETSPDTNPVVHIEQQLAVTMSDQSTRQLGAFPDVPVITQSLDLAAHGNDPVQIVDYITGVAVPGQTTTLNSVMLQFLAVVRQLQIANNP